MEASEVIQWNGKTFWPHQEGGLQSLFEAMESGKRRIVFTSPTGGGKSLCIGYAIDKWFREGKTVDLMTNRRLLLNQLCDVMRGFGIPFGVRAAEMDHLADASQPIQFVMVQTELSRKKNRAMYQQRAPSVALLDEAHNQWGGGSGDLFRSYLAEGTALVSVTATPVGCPNDLGDTLITAGKTSELRACGALLLCRTYEPDVPRGIVNLKPTKTGEFQEGDVVKAIMSPTIHARVIEWLRKINPDLEPSILFGPNVAGSIYFAEQLTQAGIRSAHIDGEKIWIDGETHSSSQELRAELLRESKNGDIKVLCNRFVCLDSETEILTDQGWIDDAAITEHHKVVNWDCGSVYFDFPTEIVRRKRAVGERMVVLETPRRSIRVTESHDLLYRTTSGGTFLKVAARDLVGRVVALPVSGFSPPHAMQVEQPEPLTEKQIRRRITANAYEMRKRGYCAADSRGEAEKRIRHQMSLRYKNPQELTVEECEFIGFWIGDGNRNRLSRGGVEYRLTQSVACPRIIERVEQWFESMGVDYIRREKTVDGRGHATWSLPRGTGFGPQKRRGLFYIEPYLEKDGTDLFWGLNEDQFTALIRGLWMADGFPHNDNTDFTSRVLICGLNRALFD